MSGHVTDIDGVLFLVFADAGGCIERELVLLLSPSVSAQRADYQNGHG
jgi:hypothetical protein